MSELLHLTNEWMLIAVVFAMVFFLALAALLLITSRNPLTRLDAAGGANAASPLPLQKLDGTIGAGAMDDFLGPIADSLTPKDDQKLSTIRLHLIRAGIYSPRAVGKYFLIRFSLAIIAPIATSLFLFLFPGNPDPKTIAIVVVSLATLGYFMPLIFVRSRITRRQEAAREGFPDALDMLLVCVEAGLSLAAALNRVGQEVGRAHPILGEQFQLVGLEMQAGVGRERALRNLANRIGIEDVNTLVTLLVQSDALGTSIGQSLRIHADDMRRMRMLRAEERANKLPVKMAFPLILFILPALVTVIMTPIIIRIARVLGPAMTGG